MSEEVKREAAKREAERNEDWRMTGDSYCNGWDRGFDVGWNAAASRWRSIAEDGLPTEEGSYLCSCTWKGANNREAAVWDLRWDGAIWSDDHEYEDINDYWNVIAWQPKPAPYTGDDAEERQDES